MIAPTLLVILGGLCLGMIGMGYALLRAVARQDLRQRRIEEVTASTSAAASAAMESPHGLPLRLIAGLGMLLSRSGILPAATLAELEQTLVVAGLRQSNALALFVGTKLLLLLSLPAILYVAAPRLTASPFLQLVLPGAGAIVGLLLPDFVLRRRRSAYLAAVARGLPDALDMLVICSEAGLGLEAGLDRVAVEIAPVHPAISRELKLTCDEMRILADRRTALTNIGTRTGMDTLKRLGGTLAQTLQYGTPLSQAMRTLATELRYETLMRFEAQAARLPVLLTVPMILFILPCIFIVVGGPAGMTVARIFGHH